MILSKSKLILSIAKYCLKWVRKSRAKATCRLSRFSEKYDSIFRQQINSNHFLLTILHCSRLSFIFALVSLLNSAGSWNMFIIVSSYEHYCGFSAKH